VGVGEDCVPSFRFTLLLLLMWDLAVHTLGLWPLPALQQRPHFLFLNKISLRDRKVGSRKKLETGLGKFKHFNLRGIGGYGASAGEWEEYRLGFDGQHRAGGPKGLFLCCVTPDSFLSLFPGISIWMGG